MFRKPNRNIRFFDEQKLSTFTMPKDGTKDKIILALHDYSKTETNIDKMLNRIKKYYIDKNIPVDQKKLK